MWYETPLHINVDKSTFINNNAFISLKSFKFYNIWPKKKLLKSFEKVEILSAPAGFKLMIYRFLVNLIL